MTVNPMFALVMLLSAHFVGDFLFQSDRMALGKSKSVDVLSQHVLVYTAILTACAADLLQGTSAPRRVLLEFALMTGVLHFATDFVTSRITSKLWFLRLEPAGKKWRQLSPDVATETTAYYVDDLGTRHRFFVMIGFDQLLHVYALAATWWYLTQ